MEKAYKFRIYPNRAQENLIRRTFGCARYVYNAYLAKRKEAYEADNTALGYAACSRDMTSLKRELSWLREVDSTALQSALRNLDDAYKNFFRRVRKGEEPGFPKFNSKRDSRRSYTSKCVGTNIKVLEKKIQLPKLGLVKCRVSKRIEGSILSATVSRNPSDKYFVSVCCTDADIKPLPKTGAAIGIDLGIRTHVATSDEQKFENHRFFDKSQIKLARLQKQLSRKQKGSRNREKARIKVARAHEKIARLLRRRSRENFEV
jgi:putative transposase